MRTKPAYPINLAEAIWSWLQEASHFMKLVEQFRLEQRLTEVYMVQLATGDYFENWKDEQIICWGYT